MFGDFGVAYGGGWGRLCQYTQQFSRKFFKKKSRCLWIAFTISLSRYETQTRSKT